MIRGSMANFTVMGLGVTFWGRVCVAVLCRSKPPDMMLPQFMSKNDTYHTTTIISYPQALISRNLSTCAPSHCKPALLVPKDTTHLNS